MLKKNRLIWQRICTVCITSALVSFCMGVGEAELDKIVEGKKAQPVTKKKKPKKKKNLTLAQIKKKYGNITEVILLSGKSYLGYFKSSGGWMTIITPNGTVKVKQTKVKQIKPYP